MEARGYCHYQLPYFLLELGIKVSVENPLLVKRMIKMELRKDKTDKRESRLIYKYPKQLKLRLWKGRSKHQTECLQTTKLLSEYTEQSTMLKNKLHGKEVLSNPSKLSDPRNQS